jgi:hypothetical protein
MREQRVLAVGDAILLDGNCRGSMHAQIPGVRIDRAGFKILCERERDDGRIGRCGRGHCSLRGCNRCQGKTGCRAERQKKYFRVHAEI